MSTFFSYNDEQYIPAAPTIKVKVYTPGKPRKERVIEILIDTGADNTILPLALLHQLEAPYLETYRMRGITGKAMAVDLFGVSAEIDGIVIRGIRAIGMPTNEAILGRDVLNRLTIVLNGPSETVEIFAKSE